jgi:hypothetical protein
MFSALIYTHSVLRWIILILLIVTIVKAFAGWLGRKEFTATDNKLGLYTMISLHIQLLIGFILYFVSPTVKTGLADMGNAMRNTELRYWAVEHALVMIIAIILITVGRVSARKATTSLLKHKKTAIYFLIGLILILSRIPFPFTTVSRPWLP